MKRVVLYLLMLVALPAMAQPGFFGRQDRRGPTVERRYQAEPFFGGEQRHGHHVAPPEERGMHPRDFDDAVRVISEENFDERRLATAQRIVEFNPMSARQIARICRLFTFESNRLAFAKFAYFHCVDANNYFLVEETFTFSASKEALYEYITQP